MSSSDFTEHILNTFAEKLNTTLQWVHDNPIQTIALLLQILVLFSPSLVIAPILNALGFAANGVRAGESLSKTHNKCGSKDGLDGYNQVQSLPGFTQPSHPSSLVACSLYFKAPELVDGEALFCPGLLSWWIWVGYLGGSGNSSARRSLATRQKTRYKL